MRTGSAVVVPALVTSLLLLSGCAAQGGDGSGAGVEQASGSSVPQAPSDGDTGAETADPSADARVTVRDVRLGGHEGHDRLVFETGGTGVPGWDVRYVDEASAPGSGRPVEVAGNAVLQVRITGAGYPFDTGVEEYAGGPLTGTGTGAVEEVVFGATYEGTTTAFVGTGTQAPFRVYLLEDPARVVVEVTHEG
ncbi:hypothetical protein [Blastococcus montanus]|uniref:AMIN-like domain-containing (lipo)protein n=1 Tax=Blastococcus montanus TaxID=3144973 RepID=UPI00320B14C9